MKSLFATEDQIKNFFSGILPKFLEDPVKICEVYSEHGCSHVDGFLCIPSTCDIRSKYVRMPQNGRKSGKL